MDLKFTIEGQSAELGIFEGYIQEGINEVTFIELLCVTPQEMTDEECEDMLGKAVSLTFSDFIDGDLNVSRFDGFIFECHEPDLNRVKPGRYIYRIIIRPLLWCLNFDVRARSFPGKISRISVVDEILKEAGYLKNDNYEAIYFEPEDYSKLDQVIQCETTTLLFFQQLLQEEGINYYFSAKKDGSEPEKLRLVDRNACFQHGYKKDIPWNPESGMLQESNTKKYRIDRFHTHFHSTPGKVVASASFGDGKEKAYEVPKDVEQGITGIHQTFQAEGEKEAVAKKTATVISQGFEANRVTFEGRSYHYLIRAGEKININRVISMKSIDLPKKKKREVLITSVKHYFHQRMSSALMGENKPEYENTFSAVRKNAEYRPTWTRPVHVQGTLDSQKGKSEKLFVKRLINKLEYELDINLDIKIDEPTQFDQEQTIMSLVDQLAKARDLNGIMVGTVIEDAKVTDKSELVCKIASERFPDGITAKVALGWLTTQGWLSLLPREGKQVYFFMMHGEGGQNEAVILGYRPTTMTKTLDPADTTVTHKLGAGEGPVLRSAAESVVGKQTFSPSNRHRNTLQGEMAVAEVAVIDGGEDAVAIHADKGVYITGDKELHLDGGTQCHKAGSLHQQFETVNRGVSGDQKESIGGNHEMTVIGNQTVSIEGNQQTLVTGMAQVCVPDDQSVTLLSGSGTKLGLKNDNTVELLTGEKVRLLLSKDLEHAMLEAADFSITIDPKGISAVVGNNTVNIQEDGSLTVHGDNKVTITGKEIEIKDADKITINASQEVIVTGTSAVKLNC